ncbi:MAG: PIN domain-containing protein [Acidobacteria bacterium]|nr:PIN domain-containing protein [Acidobacteriota bacterium]
MTYLDSSVALAHLLVEDRRPPTRLWDGMLVASRLIEYEVWTVLHARNLAGSHGDAAAALLGRLALLELSPPVLTRALEAFPLPVRTLDALHLASAEYLRGEGHTVELATYDERMTNAADRMGIAVFDLAR